MRITFVAQGRERRVDVDPSAQIREAARMALERLDIDDASIEEEARTAEGRILDSGKSLIEEGLAGLTRLYIGEHGSGVDGTDKIADMAGDKERRDMEFKESMPWNELKCVLTRTIMAMAGLNGGGKIIIGIKEVPGKRPDLVGMSMGNFDSYSPDDVASFVNEYAEPSVDVVPRKMTSRGKHFVVLDVEEFDEVPIICKKDGRNRAGATCGVAPSTTAQGTRWRAQTDSTTPTCASLWALPRPSSMRSCISSALRCMQQAAERRLRARTMPTAIPAPLGTAGRVESLERR